MARRIGLAIAIILALAMLSPGVNKTHAITTAPTVNRTFYFSAPSTPSTHGILSTIRPATATAATNQSFSRIPIGFDLPNFLFASISLAGPPSFNVWLSGNESNSLPVLGVLQEKPVTGALTNFTTLPTKCSVASVPRPCPLTYDPSFGLSLTYGSQLTVTLNVTLTTKCCVTMYWGNETLASYIALPLSGYSAIGPGNVQILDWTGNAATSFNLNATKGQNTVQVLASVTAAFGKSDLRMVNLTIVDQSLRPVPNAKNLTMSQFPLISTPQPPYPYIYQWTYPSNLTEGNYQVWIDIVDVQGSIAFSLKGTVGFGLFKPGIHPLDLLPYVAIAGAGVLGGTFYYRRRKKKEYLAPFDHFYTLTAGNIPQGTMVTVEGNIGAGKTLLAEQLMHDDLKAGRPCVFVSTADFPLRIRSGIRSLGLEPEPYESKEALKFVDCYSAEAGQPSQEKFYVSSPGDLTSLGVKITSAISTPSEGPSVYFDSLTPLAPKSRPESIVSFAQTVGAKVRGMGGKVFFTVGSSLDESILRQLEESSDCIIQMEAFEENGVRRRRMRITKFRNRRYHEGWVTFTIEENKGIIFYSKKPRK